MVVERHNFQAVLTTLRMAPSLSLDTETTGLRPYHGDRLFSLIIATPTEAYYFNFQPYPDCPPEQVLPREWLADFKPVLENTAIDWQLFNAKFDMHFLAQEGLTLGGQVHCAKAVDLLVYNDHPEYSLAAAAGRIGLAKSDAVEEYIGKHGLSELRAVPGKKKRVRHKFYDKVPFQVVAPYGETDARITKQLADYQITKLQEIANATPANQPTVLNLLQNERRLTKTVFKMENHGVRVDLDYCIRAARYEGDRAGKFEEAFRRETGKPYSASNKLFQDVFAPERERWQHTDKGGWSFDSDVLGTFQSPAARAVLGVRDAKARADYFNGFVYHADSRGYVHPTFNPDGTGPGRFSSSEPNFQNLKRPDEDEATPEEFPVRRAIIPPDGFILVMPDYDQMEYRMMLDYAAKGVGRKTSLVSKVLSGLDVHEATSQAATEYGTPITRSQAKTVNFLTLYGGGNQTLADGLKCGLEQARAIRTAIFDSSPEIKKLIRSVMQTAEQRGFIRNWFGRRCYFPDSSVAYRAPNYLIQGGCADVVKISMNRIDARLMHMRSKLVMTVHDELPTYVHESEVLTVPRIMSEVMETVYPFTYVPLTVSMKWSDKSLADTRKGFPV